MQPILLQVVTSETSFVAVEERGADDDTTIETPSIATLAAACDVDQLPHQGWGLPTGSLSAEASAFSLNIRLATATESASEKAAILSDFGSISSNLPATHPQRLSVGTRVATYLEMTCNQPVEAATLLKRIFDDSISELDCLSEDSYLNTTLQLQKIRDSLTRLTQKDSSQSCESEPKTLRCEHDSFYDSFSGSEDEEFVRRDSYSTTEAVNMRLRRSRHLNSSSSDSSSASNAELEHCVPVEDKLHLFDECEEWETEDEDGEDLFASNGT